MRDARDPLRAALWIAVGVGLVGTTYLPLARAGWLVHSPIGLLWPGAAAVGLAAIVCLAVRALPDCRRAPPTALIGAAAVGLGAAILLALVPPIARDELTYHLAVPALYLRAGHTVELPFILHAYYPMLVEMLYMPLLAHLPDQAPKLLHLAFGLAAGALLFLYLVRRTTVAVALLGAVLLVTTPTVLALGTTAYVDLGLLLFSGAAIIALLRWDETNEPSYLVLGALAAGCAASVKYNGLLVIALLGAGTLLAGQGRGAVPRVRLALTFGVLCLVPLLPWWIKNACDTGNPIFPLGNRLLGGQPLPYAPPIDVFTYRHALYGESWLDIALIPLRVFISGREGDPARFDGVLNPVYLLGFAAGFAAGGGRRERLLAGFAAVFIGLAMFSNVFRSRYVIPILVPLAILTAEALHRVLASGRLRAPLVVTIAGAALLFNAAHLSLLWARIDPLAYVLGRQTRSEYIARFVPEYPVTTYANAHLPAGSAVYLAFLGSRGYYWTLPYTYDVYLSGTRLCDAVRAAGDGAQIAANLRQEGITHIASADPLLMQFVRDNLTAAEYERWRQFAAGHLRPLFVENGVGLYEMVGA